MLFKKKKDVIQDPNIQEKPKRPWYKPLWLTSHYAIERFGIALTIALVGISACFAVGAYNYHKAMNAFDNRRSMYSTAFSTSKTQLSGRVVAIYGNKNRTKAFVLLRSSDNGNFPGDPKEYQFFLAGSDPHFGYTKIAGHPAGAFYMFGSTGYMGLYLVNKSGFPSQVLDLVGRINSPVSTIHKPSKYARGSFRKYDQFQIFFNPGATRIKELSALNISKEPNISQLYRSLFLVKSERAARRKLNNDLVKMETDLRQIQDRRHRLIMDKVKPLPGPKYMQGDKIVRRHGQLYLETKHVAHGGFNFDWQSGSIEKGYLNKVFKQNGVPANEDPDDFLAKMDQKQGENELDSGSSDGSTSVDSSDNEFDTQPDDSKWKLFNGKPAIDSSSDDSDDDDFNTSGTNASREGQINNDIQLLEQAWQDYVQTKIKYQTTDLEKLLELESTYSQVNDISMTNDSDKVLTLL